MGAATTTHFLTPQSWARSLDLMDLLILERRGRRRGFPTMFATTFASHLAWRVRFWNAKPTTHVKSTQCTGRSDRRSSAWMVTEDERHLTNISHGPKIYMFGDGSKPVPQLVARTSIYIYFDLHQGARVLIYIHICIENPYTRIKMHRSTVLWTFAAASSSCSGRLAVCGSDGRSVTTALSMPAPRRDTSSARRCGWGARGVQPWCTGDEGRMWSEILMAFFSGWLGWRCFFLPVDRTSMKIYVCRTLR